MNHFKKYLYLVAFLCTSLLSFAQDTIPTTASKPIITEKITSKLAAQLDDYTVKIEDKNLVFYAPNVQGLAKLEVEGIEKPKRLMFYDGRAALPLEVDFAPDYKGQLFLMHHKNTAGKKQYKMVHLAKTSETTYRLQNIPMWLSVVPPLMAIILALVFKEVLVSLFIGIWAGVFVVGGMRIESMYYVLLSFFEVVEKYVIKALTNADHMSIIVFSILIGGMVAIISRNGGMAGVVQSLSRYAKDAKSTQFITWFLGVAIFFDDYANTLIVGNTMRSVTDKFKISREKLAYIVDSTAAPVAATAFITTWIGAELSYIAGATQGLEGLGTVTPYALFISSLRYSFYPILTLCFILMVIFTQKDYGPMFKAEKRARTTGQVSSAATSEEDEPDMEDLSPVKGAPLKWYNAVIPVATVIFLTIIGLIDTGMASLYNDLVDKGLNPSSPSWGVVWSMIGQLSLEGEMSFFMKVGNLIGSSNSYIALLWASFGGVVVAILMTISQKIMKLIDAMHTMTTGFKAMLPAVLILCLAWSLAITTEELHTATYFTNLLQDSLNPYLMPPIIFVLAAFIAFSTGSSWSTMAILYPIAVPTTWAICQSQGVDASTSMELLLNVISTVLAASVLGDHCSPISDTTILSSLASDCNHIDHVRTQLPYALTVGTTSLLAGFVSTFLGGGILVCLLVLIASLGILYFIISKFGKQVIVEE